MAGTGIGVLAEAGGRADRPRPPEEGATVILRVVGGRVRPGEVDRVAASFRAAYVPVAERTGGLVRYVVGVSAAADGGHDLAAMTVWTEVEHALAAYSGDLSAICTLDALDHGEQMTSVAYYELDQSAGPDVQGGRPTLLRIAVGTVPRGLDADIQQKLRRRIPNLPAEACEVWIGRRVVDGDVEVAFISTWLAAPPDWPLDEPLWTAIADRSDAIRVSVQTILGEGVGLG